MFKKNAIIIAISLSAAFTANAADISKQTEMGLYGEVDYTTNGDNLDGRDELSGSFLNFYTSHKTKDHIILNLDIGIKNKSEAVDVTLDEWNFTANNFNVEYHEYETNTFVVVGRQFTPIGINYDNPMKNNSLFSTENPFSSVIDGVNFAYDGNANGIDLKASAFIGTRLDDVAITTSYGGNFKAGNKSFGHFNVGYMNNKLDGNFIMNTDEGSQIMTDNINVINFGYSYENHNVSLLADYNTLSHEDSVDNISQLKTKLGYNLYNFLPFVSYNTSNYYSNNDLNFHSELKSSSFGLEYSIPEILTLGAEFSKEDLKNESFDDMEEDIVRVYTKINF